MNKEQRSALRKLAEVATPGTWWHGECTPPDVHALAWMGQSFVDCEGGQKNYAAPSRDAEYIASANPSTILQLLDYIETLEKDAARYRWLRERMIGVDFDWCESGNTVLAFEMPFGCSFGCCCDKNIDAAMQGETK